MMFLLLPHGGATEANNRAKRLQRWTYYGEPLRSVSIHRLLQLGRLCMKAHAAACPLRLR